MQAGAAFRIRSASGAALISKAGKGRADPRGGYRGAFLKGRTTGGRHDKKARKLFMRGVGQGAAADQRLKNQKRRRSGTLARSAGDGRTGNPPRVRGLAGGFLPMARVTFSNSARKSGKGGEPRTRARKVQKPGGGPLDGRGDPFRGLPRLPTPAVPYAAPLPIGGA